MPVARGQRHRLRFGKDLLGPFLGGSQQKGTKRHPCRRRGPDNQFLDLRRGAQIDALVAWYSRSHGVQIPYGIDGERLFRLNVNTFPGFPKWVFTVPKQVFTMPKRKGRKSR